MKYVKLFALALGAVLFTACSDKTEYNTASDVTVQMAESSMSFNENAGIVNVPIVLTGEANGPVKITVKVEGTGTIPAEPYEQNPNGTWEGNFILSSETLNISEGETKVYAELNLLDDMDETGDREVTMTITACEGAAIGTPSSTVITIKDNESLPVYEMIQGAYTFNYLDYDGVPASCAVKINGFAEGTQEYAQGLLELEGLLNNPTILTLYLTHEEATGKYYVSMLLPEPIIWYNATNYIWVLGTSGGSPTTQEMEIVGEFDKATQTITFDPQDKIWFYVASPDFSSQLGIYDTATQMVISK